MTDISAVARCDAGRTIAITIIIVASVCSVSRTVVYTTSMKTMIVITTG